MRRLLYLALIGVPRAWLREQWCGLRGHRDLERPNGQVRCERCWRWRAP